MTEPALIALVGFMGTGKTAVGKQVAAKLGWSFLDMDAVIEERTGRKISDIFAKEGEAHFRALERQLVVELCGQRGVVIGTGGGVVLNPDNVAEFSRVGLVICLTATPETIVKRIGRSTHRPLLEGGDKERKIQELLDKRRPLYESIPNRIETDTRTCWQVVDEVLRLFHLAFR